MNNNGMAPVRAPQASRTLALLWLPVLSLLVAPIAVTPYLPLLDAPSHQARLIVLHDLLVTNTGSTFYHLDTLFLPNMAFDLAGVVLVSWVDPALAGRLFLAGTLALTLGGVAILSRVATGRWSLLPLAAALLSYNLFTILGFLGFGLGAALVFWALAARLCLMRRSVALRLAIGSLFGMALLICHVSALGIYAIMLAGIGIESLLPPSQPPASCRPGTAMTEVVTHVRRALPRAATMALELVPACVLFAMMSTRGQGKAHYDLPYWHTKIFNALKTVSCGSLAGDLAFMVGAIAVALLLAGCGRVRMNRQLLPGLLLLIAAYLAIPAHMSGGSYVDSRLPVVILLLALAACRFDSSQSGFRHPRAGRILVMLACAALVVKQGALTASWREEGHALKRVADTLNALPPGAVMLQAECQPEATDIHAVYLSRQPPLTHVAALGTADGSRFAAISWTIKGQQPIETVTAYQPYRTLQDRLGVEVCAPAQIQAAAGAARRVRTDKASATGAVDPLFFLLLRPHAPGLLVGSAALLAQTPEFELYSL